jgi:ankyrin repeat protein
MARHPCKSVRNIVTEKKASVVGMLERAVASCSLHGEVQYGVLDDIEARIAEGVDVNARDEDGRAPLHIAARNGQVESVRVLLDKGADTNTKSQNKDTPSHLAAYGGDMEVLGLLISAQADVSAKDKDGGSTPLMDTKSQKYTECVAMLEKARVSS